jgi:hypothetical protein
MATSTIDVQVRWRKSLEKEVEEEVKEEVEFSKWPDFRQSAPPVLHYWSVAKLLIPVSTSRSLGTSIPTLYTRVVAQNKHIELHAMQLLLPS